MSKHQNSSISYFHVLNYFVKWWYFSFGKSFFETSHCSMFIIMSTIIPQSFTFFEIYLIFLNSVLKSALKPIFSGMSVFGRPVRSTGQLTIRQYFSRESSVDRSGRPRAQIGRPTEFPVDRRWSRMFSSCFCSHRSTDGIFGRPTPSSSASNG